MTVGLTDEICKDVVRLELMARQDNGCWNEGTPHQEVDNLEDGRSSESNRRKEIDMDTVLKENAGNNRIQHYSNCTDSRRR